MRGYLCSVLICAVLASAAIVSASPLSRYPQNYYGDGDSEQIGPDQQLLLEILARYGQNIIRNRVIDNILSKRGGDANFGFDRGHSAAVAHKLRWAMDAAEDASGPGRKRRQAS